MFNRRRFFEFLGTLPGAGLLASPLSAAAKPATKDYFRELGVKPFINAAGTYTAMTSTHGNMLRNITCISPSCRMRWGHALRNSPVRKGRW
jgi:hypothetical protein